MLRAYVIYFRFKRPGDKKPGAVKQFRVYANTIEEARSMATQSANYPDVEILSVKPA